MSETKNYRENAMPEFTPPKKVWRVRTYGRSFSPSEAAGTFATGIIIWCVLVVFWVIFFSIGGFTPAIQRFGGSLFGLLAAWCAAWLRRVPEDLEK